MNSQACCDTKIDEALDARAIVGSEADAELAILSKAIGHPARIQMLRMLSQRESCICGDFVGEIDLAQSTISQHLKVLKEAGIVQGTISGPSVCYCINRQVLRRFKALVAGI